MRQGRLPVGSPPLFDIAKGSTRDENEARPLHERPRLKSDPSRLACQVCIAPGCGERHAIDEVHVACVKCGSLLDVRYEWDRVAVPSSLREFEARWTNRRDPLDFSGVWCFRELLPFAPPEAIVTIGEGQTILQRSDAVGRYAGMKPGNLFLQYEGLNPSGSFKDNGMTAAATHARMVGAKTAACASTGNTAPRWPSLPALRACCE